MEPTTMFLIAGAVQGGLGIFQGLGARAESELDAFNLGTEKSLARTEAMQQTRFRDDSLREALAASDSFFLGVAGREETADIRAMREFEIEKSGDDISNIELMSRMNSLKYDQEIMGVKRKGRESLLASVITAATDVGMAYASYKDVRADKLMTPQSQWTKGRATSIRPRLR